MIHYISNRIASIFVLYGESTEENKDIYTYAIEAVVAVLVNLVVCILISALFGRIAEGIIFITVFALLRRFTGGFHADSHFKCIFTFCVILTCSLFVLQLYESVGFNRLIVPSVATVAWVGILILAPIIDANKQHQNESHKKAQRKKIVLVSTFLLILCGVLVFSMNISLAVMLSLSMLSVLGLITCVHLQRLIGKQ